MLFAISLSLFHVSIEPQQRSLNKRNHLLRSFVHTVTTTCCYTFQDEIPLTTTTTTKAIFIILGKLSQLAEDVALKITLFRHLNNQQIGIMKLKMINLSIFHHCFSASVGVCGFLLFPILNDFLSSLRVCESGVCTAHTWEFCC